MLPKKIRLERNEFSKAFKQGVFYRNQYFSVVYKKQPKGHGQKFAVVCSSKIGRAAARNKIKRSIHSIIYENKTRFESDCIYIFLTKPQIASLNYPKLKKVISDSIDKLK